MKIKINLYYRSDDRKYHAHCPDQPKAARLLRELEELQLIEVLQENVPTAKAHKPNHKLSAKYRGSISQEQGQKLNEHIREMRSEWSGT